MKNYEEFNDYRMKDSNLKFKKKKKIKTIIPQEIKTKFDEFEKQKEENEIKRRELNKFMNTYVAGSSAFD